MKLLLFAARLLSRNTDRANPAGDAANGKKLFLRDGCYECHGYAGQGGAAGARIATIGLNAQGLIRYVRAPGGAMPAYTDKVITDQELTDIWAYLQTMPKAKPAKDIPLPERADRSNSERPTLAQRSQTRARDLLVFGRFDAGNTHRAYAFAFVQNRKPALHRQPARETSALPRVLWSRLPETWSALSRAPPCAPSESRSPDSAASLRPCAPDAAGIRLHPPPRC